ncbi:chaperone protein dnaJ 72 [Senna tora]|uniref:Chaperone protein dnaJ 72 n=1 Tax=Senna tora TaxID=362788 RepID=A0A834SD70_9FABA|nr:chaperone protein dnaJ 72 [Senna tora]
MDYYKILGLQRNATKDEIKSAYKKLALQFHPDKHSQSSKAVRDHATLRFRQVSEAYEVLMDDRKRADYDIRSRGGNSTTSTYYDYKPRYKSTSGISSQSWLRWLNFIYNIRFGVGTSRSGSGFGFSVNWNYSYTFGGGNGRTYNYKPRYKFGSGFRSPAFLRNLGFVGAFLGEMVVIDLSKALWEMHKSQLNSQCICLIFRPA